ncbi:MAG: hypothetical protein ABGX16_14005 [Pirellulales bacterium]
MTNASKHLLFLTTIAALLVPTVLRADQPMPPDGFRTTFNGKDLNGWHGLDPHSVAGLTSENQEAKLAQQRTEFSKHWTVENGELVNDGHGHTRTPTRSSAISSF